jgi:beta-lactamase regulating signal transducer with metallopeptidase domain
MRGAKGGEMENNGFATAPFIGLLITQATIALVVGLAASYTLRKHPARAHRALTLALVAVIVLPLATLVARGLGLGLLRGATQAPATLAPERFEQAPGIDRRDDALQGIAANAIDTVAAAPTTPARAESGVPWQRVLLWSWGVALALRFLYFVASFLGGLRILRSARLVTETPYTKGAQEASEKLGLLVTPTIFESTAVRCPSVWCWRVHPALLVPPVGAESEHDTDWSTLFTHELAHYVRRDHLADLLSALVLVLLPWHPLAWWARNRLALLSEDACDDWALTTNGTDAAGYAESLLHIAVQPRPAFVQAAASNKSHLFRRIRRITSENTGFRPRVGRAWSVGASLILTCAVAAIALAQPGAPTAKDSIANDSTSVAAFSGSPMQRALELAKALSDQRSDEKAVIEARNELDKLAGTLSVGENLLVNSDFETGEGLVPEPWTLRKKDLIAFEWSEAIGYDGSHGIHISKTDGKFPYASFVQTIESPGEDCLIRLTARVKAQHVGKAVLDLLFLNNKDEWVYHIWAQTIGEPWENGDHDWKDYVAYAYVPSGTRKIEVSAQMYWPGELWLDDFELREVKP